MPMMLTRSVIHSVWCGGGGHGRGRGRGGVRGGGGGGRRRRRGRRRGRGGTLGLLCWVSDGLEFIT